MPTDEGISDYGDGALSDMEKCLLEEEKPKRKPMSPESQFLFDLINDVNNAYLAGVNAGVEIGKKEGEKNGSK